MNIQVNCSRVQGRLYVHRGGVARGSQCSDFHVASIGLDPSRVARVPLIYLDTKHFPGL